MLLAAHRAAATGAISSRGGWILITAAFIPARAARLASLRTRTARVVTNASAGRSPLALAHQHQHGAACSLLNHRNGSVARVAHSALGACGAWRQPKRKIWRTA